METQKLRTAFRLPAWDAHTMLGTHCGI